MSDLRIPKEMEEIMDRMSDPCREFFTAILEGYQKIGDDAFDSMLDGTPEPHTLFIFPDIVEMTVERIWKNILERKRISFKSISFKL